MIQEGTPVRAAYFIKEVRNALPAKVTYSYKDTTPEMIRKRQENYISLIRDMKERLLAVKSDADIRGFFSEFCREWRLCRTSDILYGKSDRKRLCGHQ